MPFLEISDKIPWINVIYKVSILQKKLFLFSRVRSWWAL